MIPNTEQADSAFILWERNESINPDTVAKYRGMLNVQWKDPDKAKRKARIIPGIGQWYAGSKKDAVTNSVLLLLSIGGTAFLFSKGYIFTPIISGGGLIIRFYLGGRRHAVALAEQNNKKKKEYLFNTFRLLFLRSS